MSVEKSIREKLTKAFSPSELSVENESGKHAGHSGARDHLGRVTGETHFRVRVVSSHFRGQKPGRPAPRGERRVEGRTGGAGPCAGGQSPDARRSRKLIG